MPGPVSQSHNPANLRDHWSHKLAAEGFRYFVLKVHDVVAYLDADELEQFNDILKKIETCRRDQNKPVARAFWVYARHWPKADKVRELIEKLLGIKIGEPYEPEE